MSTAVGELEVVEVTGDHDVRVRRRRPESRRRSRRTDGAPAGAAWPPSLRTGGWNRPNSGSSPPLQLKWLAITKTVLPRNVNSPASGLRLLSNAGFVGSIRPGRVGQLDLAADRRRRRPAWSASPPGRSTNYSRAVGAEQEPDPDVAARLAAVLRCSPGRSARQSYAGPPAAAIAATSWCERLRPRRPCRRSTGAVVVLDLLQREDVGRAQVRRR